jgi:hypothetical protein
MLSASPGPPPEPPGNSDWIGALKNWSDGLWVVYHRHPWVLPAASTGPPLDPGQLAWLDAGLATLADTGLPERDKLAAVMAVLHFTRGAAALSIEAGHTETVSYPAMLGKVLDRDRFPALTAALDAGAFDGDEDHLAAFHSGLDQFIDGIASRITHR